MCRNMVDIQSATAEIRRGLGEEKRRKKEERKKPQDENIMACLFHRATIIRPRFGRLVRLPAGNLTGRFS